MWIDPYFRQQGIAKYKELKDDGKFEGLTRVQIIKLLRSETGLGLAECSSIYRELNTMTILLDKLTDDKTVIGNILTGLKKKGGYCPCKTGKKTKISALVKNIVIQDIVIVHYTRMPKYTLHVPVYGSLDLVITAENEQEVLERYLEERDNLLKFNDGKLQDDLDISYVVQINDKTQC